MKTSPIEILAQERNTTVQQIRSEVEAACQEIETGARAKQAKRKTRRNRTSRIGSWLPI